MKNKQRKLALYRATRYIGLRGIRFLKYDIWRLTSDEIPPPLRLVVGVIKVVFQTTRSFIHDLLIDRASALTYSTVLSVVPMLAVIVGVAKGFGLQNVVRDALMEALPGQREQLAVIFEYVENYLSQVQGGLFIGVGLAILLYTVLMLMISIEDTFNQIWQAPHRRAWSRRIFNYLGLFLLLPLVITISSLITLTMTTIRTSYVADMEIFSSFLNGLLSLAPTVASVCIFVGLYMYLPNVRVRFVPALISGALAGIAYQIFQSLYISGVIWISRYNAIYGSFAAVPLFLLFMQLTWTIALYGAQLCYTIQNIRSFAYGQASLRVSRRYLDFVSLIVLSRIVQRFGIQGAEPYRAETLSDECRIPLRMTGDVLARLSKVGLITEVHYGDAAQSYYQPAVDPDIITVSYTIERLDRYGTEDFRIDRHGVYQRQWQAMLTSRKASSTLSPETLLRDL